MWSSPLPLTEKKRVTRIIHNSSRDGCSCCYDYLIDCSLTRHPWNVYLKTIQHGDPASTHITTTNSRRHVEHQTQKRLRWIPRSSRDFSHSLSKSISKCCTSLAWLCSDATERIIGLCQNWGFACLSQVPVPTEGNAGCWKRCLGGLWGLWDVQGSLGPPTWFDTTSYQHLEMWVQRHQGILGHWEFLRFDKDEKSVKFFEQVKHTFQVSHSFKDR